MAYSISGHQLERYGLHQGTNLRDMIAYIRTPIGGIWAMAYIRASIGGIRLISGHQLEGYDGLYQGTNRMDLAYIRAPTEGIWLMLGHQEKGYGLWEGIKT
jgi:hypothetical protein